MTERQLQDAVQDAARLGGWLHYHTLDSRGCAPGFPDLILARPGQVRALELKTVTGRVTAAQSEWITTLDGATVTAEIARPADLDRLITELTVR